MNISTPGIIGMSLYSASMDDALRRNKASALGLLSMSSSSTSSPKTSSSTSVSSETGDNSAGDWSPVGELVAEIEISGEAAGVGEWSPGSLVRRLPLELWTGVGFLLARGVVLGVACLEGTAGNASTGFGRLAASSGVSFGLCKNYA